LSLNYYNKLFLIGPFAFQTPEIQMRYLTPLDPDRVMPNQCKRCCL